MNRALLQTEEGFGAKFEAKVLAAADFNKQNAGLLRLDKAAARAHAAVLALKERHPESSRT